ncbi:MAG: Asp-tRNA(Asn)/Glu-tRNA(Gln) amidotransferase subunit GatA [Methylococcaceae bacterium]|nr:Asp-tRNA(Asn)/Glu-tRNA(Gln) amidotransferase subunit GatA [Methylococcaceae bacterium]
MQNKTLAELSRGLREKQFSSLELTEHFLRRIRRHDPSLNAFVTVTEEQALQQAKAADLALASGQAGPLTGIPIAHKDIFCTLGVRTSCGSKMLDNFISPYNATVVERFNQAGTVMLGKLNMDEFAMGSSNETSYYGPVKNPWDLCAVPGGSSGGSAAAVAARLTPGATGTDTGGSIRQPAAFCGITGIKPTYGRVSRWGMIAYASSLDQGGPMARSAEDCALLLQAMSGFDTKDSTSVDQPVPDYIAQLNEGIAGVRIGVPNEWFGEDLSEEVGKAVQSALAEFERLGAKIVPITLPHVKYCIPCYYVIAMSEASSNLARFDGVRFGYRCQNPKDLLDLYTRSRGEGFGAEVKRRIMIGTYALSAGYYDAYYLKAQRIRRLIAEDFRANFGQCDVIAGPVAPTTAFKLGAHSGDPVQMYLEDVYTMPLNLAGLPGMSIPVGFDCQRHPVGMQLIGYYWQEALLLRCGTKFQESTDWHRRAPLDVV